MCTDHAIGRSHCADGHAFINDKNACWQKMLICPLRDGDNSRNIKCERWQGNVCHVLPVMEFLSKKYHMILRLFLLHSPHEAWVKFYCWFQVSMTWLHFHVSDHHTVWCRSILRFKFKCLYCLWCMQCLWWDLNSYSLGWCNKDWNDQISCFWSACNVISRFKLKFKCLYYLFCMQCHIKFQIQMVYCLPCIPYIKN